MMKAQDINFLVHGLAEPPAEPRRLTAGPISFLFGNGDLRYLKLGRKEVLRRVYAAVRDRNWGTIPGTIRELDIADKGTGFEVRYQSEHRAGEIAFDWEAVITGNKEGEIRFSFKGIARSSFFRNRIGLCLLHPILECAGTKCRALYTNGTTYDLKFPELVATEQPIRWLHDLAGLAHQVEPGCWAELRFYGDTFEMEDQRNWIDASYKTFCTPLRLPFPMQIKAGTTIQQEILLRLVEREEDLFSSTRSKSTPTIPRPGVKTPKSAPVTITLGNKVPGKIPSIGFGAPSDGHQLSAEQTTRLKKLRPAHIRVDVKLWEPAWADDFNWGLNYCRHLGTQMELALHLDQTAGTELEKFATLIGSHERMIRRILLFQRGEKSTTRGVLEIARKNLPALLELVVGTNADLYHFNLSRPPADAGVSGVCWSMNPQVHAFDNASIAETPEAVLHQLRSVQAAYPDKEMVVSPITLKPRFNPVATGPEPEIPKGELPPQVDPRQLSLCAASWTLAMVRNLAEGGAASVTFFETSGWRGLMENETGSPIPERFPSRPNMLFPVYHLFSALAEFGGGTVVESSSTFPREVTSLCVVNSNGEKLLLLGNLSSSAQEVTVTGGKLGNVAILSAETAAQAQEDPMFFQRIAKRSPGNWLILPPRAVAFAAGGHG